MLEVLVSIMNYEIYFKINPGHFTLKSILLLVVLNQVISNNIIIINRNE